MCRKSYGERHEYVKINGRKHYVVHPKKPHHKRKVLTHRMVLKPRPAVSLIKRR